MVRLSIEDVFKCMTKRTVQGACATLALKGLHECLIQLAERSKNGKRHFNVIMVRRNMA